MIKHMVQTNFQKSARLPISILVLITLTTVGSCFPSNNQIFDLASQATPLYLLLALACTAIFLKQKNKFFLFAGCLLFAINAVPILDLFSIRTNCIDGDNSLHISVLEINLCAAENKNYDKFLALVNERNPDIIGIVEVSPDWVKIIRKLFQGYPYRVIDTTNGGIALLSRYPLANSAIQKTENQSRPRIYSEIRVGDQGIDFELVHLVTPHHGPFELRNAEFLQLGNEMRSCHDPTLVCGDFNCAPWSLRFRDLLSKTNYADSENGFGLQPSWSENVFRPLFPIDHLLTRGRICIDSRSVGPDIGSDHLPLFAKLTIARNR
ncbi:MAG TPA: endonuclease/exonuclease/phosphatase family protein [Oculatellaceae cyanobacterium]